MENPTNLVRNEYSYPFRPSGYRFQIGYDERVAYLGTLAYHFEGNPNVNPKDLRLLIKRGVMEPDSMRFSLEQDQFLAEQFAREELGLESDFAISQLETLEEVRDHASGTEPSLFLSGNGAERLAARNLASNSGGITGQEAEAILASSLAIVSTGSAIAAAGAGVPATWGWTTGAVQFMGVLIAVQTVHVSLKSQNRKNLVELIESELNRLSKDLNAAKELSRELDIPMVSDVGEYLLDARARASNGLAEEILMVRLQRSMVRECAKRTLCFEYAFHVGIFNTRTMRFGYEEVFVYTNPTALGPEYDYRWDYFGGRLSYPPLYETRLPGPSKRIKESRFFSKNQGVEEVLRAEFDKALAQTRDAILNRLKEPRFTGEGPTEKADVALIHDSEPLTARGRDDIWRLSVWGLNGEFGDYESPVDAQPGAVEIRYRLEKEDPETSNTNIAGAAVRSAAAATDAVLFTTSAILSAGTAVIQPTLAPMAKGDLSGNRYNEEHTIRHTVEAGKSYILKVEEDPDTPSRLTVWLEEMERTD